MGDLPASAPRLRVFASAPGAPRHRRATDALLLIVSLAVGLLLILVRDVPTSADTAISAALESLNPLVSVVWSVSYLCLLLWGLTLLVIALVRPGRRSLALVYIAAAALAVALGALATWLTGTPLSVLWQSLLTTETSTSRVALRVAVATAVVVAAAPELTRTVRRVGMVILLAGAVADVALGLSFPTGAVCGLAVGTAAAAIVRLVRGSTAGLLTPDQIAWGLAELSFPVTDVGATGLARPGVQTATATAADGSPCWVTVYGRDAQRSDAAGSLWTAVRRRGESAHLARGRDQAVEHEALATLLAARAGVSVLSVRTAGESAAGDGLLVLDSPARALADADELDDAALTDVLGLLAPLHAAGISHGSVSGRSIVQRVDGAWALTDLSEATVGLDDDDARVDTARLLVSTALVAGIDRTSAAAVATIGADAVTAALPYLQSIALDRHERGAVKEGDWQIKELAAAFADAAGTTVPKRVELRRITPVRIFGAILAVFITYTLISLVTQVDWSEVATSLADANYALLGGALVLSLGVQVGYATAEMASVTARLRFGPVLILEYAIGFIQVVIPSTAARLALLARFMQKFGVAPSRAVTASAIASFLGLLVQATLLLLIVLLPVQGFTTSPTTSSDSSSSDTSSTSSLSLMGLVALIVVFLLIGVVGALAIPRTRARILARMHEGLAMAREQAREVRGATDVLRRPRNVLQMVGGNLAAQLVQAAVLGVCVLAFGQSATFPQLILINTAAALLNGLAPVPGGIGVVEATLTLGLTAIGIPSSTAIGIAIAFRFITFYIPPLWGAPALGWLRRHEYL